MSGKEPNKKRTRVLFTVAIIVLAVVTTAIAAAAWVKEHGGFTGTAANMPKEDWDSLKTWTIVVVAVLVVLIFAALIVSFLLNRKRAKQRRQEITETARADANAEMQQKTIHMTAEADEVSVTDEPATEPDAARPAPLYGTRYIDDEDNEIEPDDERVNAETEPEPTQKNSTAAVKAPAKKTPTKPKTAKKPTQTRERMGKYVIINVKKTSTFRYILRAGNGQLLYESRDYASKSGCKQGITAFKNAVENGVFTIDDDKSGRFKFLLQNKSAHYEGETLSTRELAENNIESLRHNAKTETITEEITL